MSNSSKSDEQISKILLSHKFLVDELANINQVKADNSNPFDRREFSEKTLVALMRYVINAVPYEVGANSVDAIHELIGALTDTDNGKNAPLFIREIKTPNRNTKHGEGVAYDLMIAVRHYLIHTEKFEEGIAEDKIQQKLYQNGIDKNVESICRAHNVWHSRNNKRPDMRKREIRNYEEMEIILNEIVKLLIHQSTFKTAPNISS